MTHNIDRSKLCVRANNSQLLHKQPMNAEQVEVEAAPEAVAAAIETAAVPLEAFASNTEAFSLEGTPVALLALY